MKKLQATFERWPRNARGALWMLASAVTFTLMTTLIKYLGNDYPAALQTFYRQAASLIVLLPVIVTKPREVFATTRPGILIFRAAAGIAGLVLSFYAYQKMPLAEANALSFTRALWMVPLAAFVLGETIGLGRVVATIVGFGGVLLMLLPNVQDVHLGGAAAAALLASLLMAFTITGMKVMSRDHTTLTIMAWSAVLGVVFSIPLAIFEWRWPPLTDLALLATMGVLGMVTQGCYIKGMSAGDAAAMAPMDYTRLVFAVVLGYLLFNDVPRVMTMMGAAVVIGSTLYITFREIKLGTQRGDG